VCPKVQDITTDELHDLIVAAVTETMEDMIEDFLAVRSPEYIQSIEEAREDYQNGNVKPLEKALDV